MPESTDQVVVYGTDWCGVTQQALRHLDDLGVPYQYVNIEQDSRAAAWVRDHNGGMELKPTIDVGGEVLSAPAADVLGQTLRQHGLTR